MAFLAWIADIFNRFKDRGFSRLDASDRRQDESDKRQEAVFEQSLRFNDIVTRQFEKQGEQIKILMEQNADQAIGMKVLQRQIQECQEHHEECERDRDRLTAQIAFVNSKVTNIETKLLPEPK